MKDKSINYSIARFSIFEEAFYRVSSAFIGYIERIQAEQAEAKLQITKKRQMQNEYHQEMVDGLPLEQRLKMGNYRH